MTKPIRPIRIEGEIAYITLTKGYEAVIDSADVHLVEKHNWQAFVKDRTVYARRTDHSGPKQRTVLMHRVIMGEPDGLEVDHEDGNGLNNRRYNMRKATKAQNAYNQRLPHSNTSGFKGVYLDQAAGKWRAMIRFDGGRKNLGYFDTPEAAHAAYCITSADLHGEFGRTK